MAETIRDARIGGPDVPSRKEKKALQRMADNKTLGQIAREASGESGWEVMAPSVQAHWERIALAVAEALSEEQIDNLRGLDTDKRVRFYEHDFYVLSNFSAFRVAGWGRDFDTSEHAYHWHKFPDRPDIQDNIQCAWSAHEAFKYAEAMKPHRRPDWDDVKVGIMREILRAKAMQHEYVRRKLLATGDRELVEDSWRDDFWGWGADRRGLNMLGKLWMESAELRGIGTQEGGK